MNTRWAPPSFWLAPAFLPTNHRRLVYLSDIYPTLCDLTGAAIPSQVEENRFAGHPWATR